MSTSESVSRWIADLKVGQADAARKLFDHYYQRLARLASRRLGTRTRGMVDEDDVVSSALHSFFLRAQTGHFPELHSRHELWALLARIIECKASNLRRALERQKRAGTVPEARTSCAAPSDSEEFPALACAEPAPDLLAMMTDTLEHLLHVLDEQLRQIALEKLHGYTNSEIALHIGRSVPTVERRLRLIREKWEQELNA